MTERIGIGNTNPDPGITMNHEGREIARIKPDGTWWIVPDITTDEMNKVFRPLVETAAHLMKKVSECERAQKK